MSRRLTGVNGSRSVDRQWRIKWRSLSFQDTVGGLTLCLPAMLVLIGLFFVPLIGILGNSLRLKGVPAAELSLIYYSKFFNDEYFRGILVTTLKLGLIATLVSLLLGFPVAYYMTFEALDRSRRLLISLIVIPLAVSLIARVYGWLTILAPGGVLEKVLREVGGGENPAPFIYNQSGIVLGLVHQDLPVMILAILPVLSKLDPGLLRAAEDLGATRWRRLVSIILPLGAPGLLAGILLVWTVNLSAFVTPHFFGGARNKVMTYLVYEQYMLLVDWEFGGALSIILLLFALIMAGGYIWLVKWGIRRYGQN